jgi:hypothetical protein
MEDAPHAGLQYARDIDALTAERTDRFLADTEKYGLWLCHRVSGKMMSVREARVMQAVISPSEWRAVLPGERLKELDDQARRAKRRADNFRRRLEEQGAVAVASGTTKRTKLLGVESEGAKRVKS